MGKLFNRRNGVFISLVAVAAACSSEDPLPNDVARDGSDSGTPVSDSSTTEATTPGSDAAADANLKDVTSSPDTPVTKEAGPQPPPPAKCGGAGEMCCDDLVCDPGLACSGGKSCVAAVKASACAAGAPPWAFVSETPIPATLAPYERFTMFATFRNCSGATVPSVGAGAGAGIKLGFAAPRDYDTFGSARIPLPADVPNGSEVTIPVVMRAPPLTGTYYFLWGLVDEGKSWLSAETVAHGIQVQASAKTATICPGVTADIGGGADANAALQTCIDNTPSGGTLALPAGTYRINGEVRVSKPITITTAGGNAASSNCWDLSSAPCAVFRAADGLDAARGFFYVSSPNGVHVDRIVLDGNRLSRLGSAAAKTCAGGTNGAGFNAHSDNCANCSFTRSMSARALCGTGWEWSGANAKIENNVFYQNGDHNTKLMWADGLTLLHSDGAEVRGNRFVDNSDIDFICGGATNATFESNVIEHVLQGTYAGIMLDNFNNGTPGIFTGTNVKGNSVNCGAKLCDFGIELGPHPWYLSANIQGGTVTGNVVVGAKIQINAEGAGTQANPVTVTGNLLGPSPSTAVFGCGQSRGAGVFNVSPDSFVQTGDATVRRTFHGCP